MAKKEKKGLGSMLEAFKQTRPRTPLPRPTTFKDKTKYDRNRIKKEDRNRGEE